MPTVLREGPFRFYWYSHDMNEPPHVHVDQGSCSAKLWLQPLQMARNMGFRQHPLKRIHAIIESNQSMLLEAWYDYFGRKD